MFCYTGQVSGEVLPGHPEDGALVQLQAKAVLPDAVTGLLLGFCLLFFGDFLPTTTLWVPFLSISVTEFSEMSLDPAATTKVFSWAILSPITVLLIATSGAAVWWHDNLVQALLVGGDASSHLLVGVEDPLRLLGSLTCHGQCDSSGQRHVLLGEQVLLELHVTDPVDEEAEDGRFAVGVLCLAVDVAAHELHVALPCLGLEVGQEALH
jgi:hypothetical protein